MRKLNKESLEAIENILSRGKTAEVRPTKNGGHAVFEISRKEKANIGTDIKA